MLPRIRFGVEVRRRPVRRGTARRWVLDLADGGTLESDVLITACGQLSRPALPPIPGREEFAGAAFHSATWQHDRDLTGRRVAVVGTGASAIQFLPHVAEQAAHTTLFQLDAPHVIPKPDRPVPVVAAHGPSAGCRACCGSTGAVTYVQYELRAVAFTRWTGLMRLIDGQARRHLRRQISDPALREAVAPQGAPGCKRILLSNDYYPALERPTVAVVRTPITRVLPDGLLTEDGTVHPRRHDRLGHRLPGHRLPDADDRDRAGRARPPGRVEGRRRGLPGHLGGRLPEPVPAVRAQHQPGPQLDRLHAREPDPLRRAGGAPDRGRGGEPSPSARRCSSRFVEWVQARITETVWDRGCTSWYRTASGRNTTNWPDFTFAYRARTRRFDEADYELTPVAAAAR